MPTISAGGACFAIGDTVNFGSSLVYAGDQRGGWRYHRMVCTIPGYISSGSVPANPFNQISTSGAGTAHKSPQFGGVGCCDWCWCWLGRPSALSSLLALLLRLRILAQRRMAFPLSRDLSSNACSFGGLLWRSSRPFYLSRPGLISISDISQPTCADDSISSDACLGNPGTTSKRLFRPIQVCLFSQIKLLGCQWRHCWRSLNLVFDCRQSPILCRSQ